MNFRICLTELPESGVWHPRCLSRSLLQVRRDLISKVLQRRLRCIRMYGTACSAHLERTLFYTYRRTGRDRFCASVVTDYVRRGAGQGGGCSIGAARRHDNEFPGVYDHATSSNPSLPFRPRRIRMHARYRYATPCPHLGTPRLGSNIGNGETSLPILRSIDQL